MRIKSIIMSSLFTDQQIITEKLERAMNNNGLGLKDAKLDDEITEIKYQLRELVIINQMVDKWRDVTSIEENDKKNG
jgi:hypothetical protein